ncbi:MAG: hypothetical protein HY926_00335 [Elusimicrobia bacterium]|nr:hypothetical protein [Elusimicrobiota bacterium]
MQARLTLLLLLAAGSAQAAAFPREEFLRLKETALGQAALARADFLSLRDELCPRKDDACIASQEQLAERFLELSGSLDLAEAMVGVLEDPAVPGAMSPDEKRALRREFSRLLSGIVIWVHGLDDLLEVKWGDEPTQARLGAAQARLQQGVDRFAAAQFSLARRVLKVLGSLPL